MSPKTAVFCSNSNNKKNIHPLCYFQRKETRPTHNVISKVALSSHCTFFYLLRAGQQPLIFAWLLSPLARISWNCISFISQNLCYEGGDRHSPLNFSLNLFPCLNAQIFHAATELSQVHYFSLLNFGASAGRTTTATASGWLWGKTFSIFDQHVKNKQIEVKPGLDHWRNKLKITFHHLDLRTRSVRGRSDDWKAQVGKALWRPLHPACCSKQGQIHSSSRLPRDSSRQFWNSWWMEVPAPLWALIQGTTLSGNNFFLISTLISCVPACACCLLFFCYPFLRRLPYI